MQPLRACASFRSVWQGGTALVAVVVLMVIVSACGDGAAGSGLRVIASTSILADLVQRIGGDALEVESLIPPNVDPHAYEPTPGDVRRIAESDLIVLNGAHLEGQLEETIREAAAGKPVIVASDGLAPRAPSGDELFAGDTEPDPHFWLDPVLVRRYVRTIWRGLKRADAGHAETFKEAGAHYLDELKGLDAWIRSQVATIPSERRLLVTDHSAWGYFADRYGFRLVGALAPSVSGADSPSARQLAQLVKRIRGLRVPAIFVDVSESDELAQQVAREAGVPLVHTLRSHALSSPSGPAPTYLEMMRHDVRQIVEALR